MAEKVRTWSVSHYLYGAVFVTAADTAEAIREAAGMWGASWTRIAAYCDVRYEGESVTGTCRKCGRRFVSLKDRPECPVCESLRRAAERRWKKKYAPGRDGRLDAKN